MLNIHIIIAATAFNRKSNLVGALCYLFNTMLALLKIWELQLQLLKQQCIFLLLCFKMWLQLSNPRRANIMLKDLFYYCQYIQGVPEFADTECIAWLSVPKEATFFFGKIASEHYFLNQSNLNLTNKHSRLCMNQERRAHGVRDAWACTLLYYFAKDFMKTMGGGDI